jgi:hypothetical protein
VAVGASSEAIPQQERFWVAQPSLRFDLIARKYDLDRINGGVVNESAADILAVNHTIRIRSIADNLALDWYIFSRHRMHAHPGLLQRTKAH